MQFGIFNNLVGQKADVPHVRLPDALVCDESSAFYYWRDAMRRMPGRTQAMAGVRITDTYPILHYHYHRATNGNEYLFAFTKAHAYVWDGSAWDLMFTCSSNCTTWSTENFGQYVVATNNMDKVQYWSDTTPATAFAPLGGVNGILYDATHYLTRAKVVFRHWKYLHLMNVVKDGTSYPHMDQWCDAGDMTSWREDHPAGGDANFRELGPNDEIVGVGAYDVQSANQLIVFTQHTVNAAWLVTDDLVYEGHDILSATGSVGHDSIVNGPDGNLYYMSTDDDGVREIRRVYDPNPLSYDIQPTLDDMHPNLSAYSSASYMGKFRQLWWSIPSTGASTANDKVIIYSLETQTWQPDLSADIVAFGYYTQQDTVYINDVADYINDVSVAIDSYAPTPGIPTPICSDVSGYTWTAGTGIQDKGVSYTGSIVLATTFGDTLNQFKRVHGAWLYFVSYPGTTYTAAISIRKGDSADYVSIGSVSLAGNGKTVRQWLKFDKRMRDCHIKIDAVNPCAFLGMVFDLDLQGARL